MAKENLGNMALQLSEKLVCSSHVLPSKRERALNMTGQNT